MNCNSLRAGRGILLLAFALGGGLIPHVAVAAEDLDELVAEYRAHALPLPPDTAKLVMREHDDGSINGVPQSHFELAFFIAPGKTARTATYWHGCEPVTLERDKPDVDAAPTSETVSKTRPAELPYRWKGFEPLPDLALAIQCKARGWDEMAEALLQRSRKPIGSRVFDRQPSRPRGDRQALAMLAWNYWCNQFASRKLDRAGARDHLRRLLDGPYGLDSQANRNIVADIDATLAPRNSKAGSLEAAIDGLIELETKGYWPGGRGSFGRRPDISDANFRNLRDAGLEAVPTLIKHLRDNRLTRCMQDAENFRYTWHIRIADVVAVLLNGLNPDGFAYDFRMQEGRGISLDETHVLHWWTETQGTKALDYLVTNAVTNSRGKLQANEGPLRALGQRFPDELVKVFEAQVGKVDQAHVLFKALAGSKASDEQKSRLFLATAKSDDASQRTYALRELLPMKHPEAVPLLVRELENIPRTPKAPYWLAGAGRTTRLLNETDDNRAWNAFVVHAKRVDVGQRLEMIQAAAGCSERHRDRLLAVLSRFLDDAEVRTIQREPQIRTGEDPSKAFERLHNDPFSGPCAGFIHQRLAVRDFAALQIARELDLAVDENREWTDEDWAKLRERVQTALAGRQ